MAAFPIWATSFNFFEDRTLRLACSTRDHAASFTTLKIMRKSREVPLTLLAAFALSTTACRDKASEIRHCVDAQGHIVQDTSCQNQPYRAGYLPMYRYVYGGSSGGRIGDTVYGSHASTGGEESGVSRGGFGHSGGGDGGGE
jgi:hypothetical protein